MNTNLLIFGIVVIVAIAFVIQFKSSRTFPYVKAGPLLSAAERVFYAALSRAVDVGDVVMVKVRVADLIKIKEGVRKENQNSQWWKAFAQIAQKHADFVVLDRKTFYAKAVIELDDASHRQAKAKENDNIKNKAFGAAGIPLVRVKAAREYDVNVLAQQLIAAMSPAPSATATKSAPAPRAK
jgi:very-short-patch-repair endonuclease